MVEMKTLNMLSMLLVVILTIVHEGACQDPKVKITSTQPPTFREKVGKKYHDIMNAMRDDDVTISCYVEDLGPKMLVRWRKSYQENPGSTPKQIFISTDMAITDNTKYSIEKPTDYTWRLRIKDIQVWDEGIYECFVQLTQLSVESQSREVNVLVPPYLTPAMVSPDTSVTRGEDLNLLCNATGRPTPTIEWTRLGGALLPLGKEKHLGGMLPIDNVRARDRGEYRCRAWNSIGTITRDIQLNVKFEPEVTAGANPIVYQATGYSTTLQCYIEANPTPAESDMKWVKDGLTYTVSTQKYIVRTLYGAFNRLVYEIIIDGVEEDDYGTYTCHVGNSLSLGGPTRQNVRLAKSRDPVKSPKLGRVVKAGEWQRRFNGEQMQTDSASNIAVSIATILTCLVTIAIHT